MHDEKRELLRHAAATLAYRAAKVLRTAPASIADVRICDSTRSAPQILSHINDILDWTLFLSGGGPPSKNSVAMSWNEEVDRFFVAMEKVDAYFASESPINAPIEKLFQGPIADALTHVGQLAMLSRVAGTPVRGENYFRAEIAAGRVGREQMNPVREFD